VDEGGGDERHWEAAGLYDPGPAFAFRSVGPRHLRGFDAPIELFVLERA
jgi:class 3 adenylate cyclase